MSASSPYERRALTRVEYTNLMLNDPVDMLAELINSGYEMEQRVFGMLGHIVMRANQLTREGTPEKLAAEVRLAFSQLADDWFDERQGWGYE